MAEVAQTKSQKQEKVAIQEPDTTDLSLLKTVPIFAGIGKKELQALRSQMSEENLTDGQVVPADSTNSRGFHIVKKGQVEFVAKDDLGKDVVVGQALAGEYFGELSALTADPSPFVARAVGDTQTLELEPHEFEAFIQKHPKAAVPVLKSLSERVGQTERILGQHVSKNINEAEDAGKSFGAKVSDAIASTVGSWKFVLTQTAIVASWITWNSMPGLPHFDAFPFILLNLGLSMQAAYTGPMLQMSANRQAKRDRLAADNDHHVNLKTEIVAEELLKRVSELEKKIDKLNA